jgi:predicted phage-related endonuclease
MENKVLVIKDLQPTVTKDIKNVIVAKKSLEKQYKEMTKQLKESMEEFGIYSYKDDNITISYTCESNPISVDLDKLKTKYPDVYNDCLKTTYRSSSITIKENTQGE